MTGGYIHDNQANWGGAIYLGGRANFNMSGGVIENNHAITDDSKIAAGGGIASWSAYLDGTNTTTISGNAMIRHNRSDEMGGGISLGTNSASLYKLALSEEMRLPQFLVDILRII